MIYKLANRAWGFKTFAVSVKSKKFQCALSTKTCAEAKNHKSTFQSNWNHFISITNDSHVRHNWHSMHIFNISAKFQHFFFSSNDLNTLQIRVVFIIETMYNSCTLPQSLRILIALWYNVICSVRWDYPWFGEESIWCMHIWFFFLSLSFFTCDMHPSVAAAAVASRHMNCNNAIFERTTSL